MTAIRARAIEYLNRLWAKNLAPIFSPDILANFTEQEIQSERQRIWRELGAYEPPLISLTFKREEIKAIIFPEET